MTSTCLSTTWPDNSLQTVRGEVKGGRRGIEKEGVREREGAGTIREREKGQQFRQPGNSAKQCQVQWTFQLYKTHMNTHTHSHTQSNTITHTHTNYVRDYAKSESESECEHVRSLCDHFAMRTSCQATDCKQQQQQHTSQHSSSSAGECVRRGVAGEGGNVLRPHVHLNAA